MNIRNISLILILCSFSLVSLCQNAALKIIDTAGCNLAINQKISDAEYSLKSTSYVANWFSGVLANIDTTKELTFSLCIEENNANRTTPDISKWEGLWPVYSYGRYWDYNSFVHYSKNADGYWVSNDPFLTGDAKTAGNNKTPTQTVIPAELAEEFLSKDGNYWSAWAEIQNTSATKAVNTFFMTKQFNSSTTAIAMRYPYTYDYQLQYVKKAEKAKIPGVTVYNIGTSSNINKQNLYVIEVSDPTATEEELQDRRVVLMYANEDGNEPDSSWVVNGAMNYLIQGLNSDSKEVKDILSQTTFLFIPLLNPDGWRESSYGSLTYSFYSSDFYYRDIKKEVVSYTKFINEWAGDKKRRLDIICTMHNIECAEGPNIMFPIIDNTYKGVEELSGFLLKRFGEYKVSDEVWTYGFMFRRFNGWCSEKWGGLQILTEINSRYPEKRLSLYDLDKVGEMYVKGFSAYFESEEYEYVLPDIYYRHMLQTERRNKFLASGEEKTVRHIISNGF